MPTISVIVPVYKVEPYLDRCVKSILVQTYTDFELILVDDGSPDNCPAMCDAWAEKDSRITVIHQANGGLSAARNAGIAASRGEYLCFVDSDDAIRFDMLALLMKQLVREEADVAMGQLIRFAEEDELIEARAPRDGVKATVLSGTEVLHGFFDPAFPPARLVSACGKLFRRTLFDGIEFPVGRLFEDEFTTYRLYARAERVALIEAPLYFYFINDGGITGSLTLQKRCDEYDAQWERLTFFRERNDTELYHKALLAFLKTAQWDLAACRKGGEPIDADKRNRFEGQYAEAFSLARRERLLDFMTHYDYYVLAKPRYTPLWRLRRKLCLWFGGKRVKE